LIVKVKKRVVFLWEMRIIIGVGRVNFKKGKKDG
tara:strand:- start:560 stop:661 length:102 start_codon:yes stop_codon:yes gene_type:complete